MKMSQDFSHFLLILLAIKNELGKNLTHYFAYLISNG